MSGSVCVDRSGSRTSWTPEPTSCPVGRPSPPPRPDVLAPPETPRGPRTDAARTLHDLQALPAEARDRAVAEMAGRDPARLAAVLQHAAVTSASSLAGLAPGLARASEQLAGTSTSRLTTELLGLDGPGAAAAQGFPARTLAPVHQRRALERAVRDPEWGRLVHAYVTDPAGLADELRGLALTHRAELERRLHVLDVSCFGRPGSAAEAAIDRRFFEAVAWLDGPGAARVRVGVGLRLDARLEGYDAHVGRYVAPEVRAYATLLTDAMASFLEDPEVSRHMLDGRIDAYQRQLDHLVLWDRELAPARGGVRVGPRVMTAVAQSFAGEGARALQEGRTDDARAWTQRLGTFIGRAERAYRFAYSSDRVVGEAGALVITAAGLGAALALGSPGLGRTAGTIGSALSLDSDAPGAFSAAFQRLSLATYDEAMDPGGRLRDPDAPGHRKFAEARRDFEIGLRCAHVNGAAGGR